MSLRKPAPLRLVAIWYSNLHQGFPCGLLSYFSTKGFYIRCAFVIPQPSSPLDLIFQIVFDGKCKGKTILVQARGVQEVKIPLFQENRHMKVVRLSALLTGGRLYSPGNIPGTYFCWKLSRPEGHSADGRIMSVTPWAIESATFWLVTQCFEQLRLCVSRYLMSHTNCKVHNV